MNSSKLSPHFIDLVYDALVKSFWRKGALRTFLRRSGISETFLAQLDTGESRRAWLDRLFPKLEAAEKGPTVILQMARTLAEQKSFPDLDDWDDSAAKIEAATASCAALRRDLAARDEDRHKVRERERARSRAAAIREASVRSQAELKTLRERLDALASRLGTPAGGIAFEDWFSDLMDFRGVESRRPSAAAGGPIDGSVTIEGTPYLVALKFTASPADATAVDSVRAKVETKSDATLGLMVSMSGDSPLAGKQETLARSQLLLFGSSHLYPILSGVESFAAVVRRVRRHASQPGRASLSTREWGGSG